MRPIEFINNYAIYRIKHNKTQFFYPISNKIGKSDVQHPHNYRPSIQDIPGDFFLSLSIFPDKYVNDCDRQIKYPLLKYSVFN